MCVQVQMIIVEELAIITLIISTLNPVAILLLIQNYCCEYQ